MSKQAEIEKQDKCVKLTKRKAKAQNTIAEFQFRNNLIHFVCFLFSNLY